MSSSASWRRTRARNRRRNTKNERIQPQTAENPVKKKYIEAAYQMMLEGGVNSISARKLGLALGCSPSAIYKHFRGLDELMIFASFRYLKDYYIEMDILATKCSTALEMYMETERCFANYTFREPVVFNTLMFGAFSRDIAVTMHEFFEIYREDMPLKDIYRASILSKGEFEACNMALLNDCVQEGSLAIAAERVDVVNAIIVNTYKGFLKGMLDAADPLDPARQAERYIACFLAILQPYRRA